VFLARYDVTGTAQWAKSFAPSGSAGLFNLVTGLAVDAAGNAALTGYFNGPLTFGTTTLTPSQNYQTTAFVARCGPTGAVLWAKQSQQGTAGYVYATPTGLALDPAGNVAIGGSFTGAVTFGGNGLAPGSAGLVAAFVAKYEAGTGNVLWARQSTGSGSCYGQALAADGAGNFYLGGLNFGAATFGNLTTPAQASLYGVRFDGQGVAQWVATSLGNPRALRALAPGPGGKLTLAGVYQNYFPLSPTLGVSASEFAGTDVFIARLGGAVPLAARAALAATQLPAADLYPNPARATATVRLPAGAARQPLTLLDALGREVRRYPAPTAAETTLDLRGLPAGVYSLRGAGPAASRLVVE